MASDFSRTLALLRREKRISQRTAAGDLQVSQALLSHYENGLREPGLSFVVRAADYYGVSCDYLLGRSLSREGGIAANPAPTSAEEVEVDAELACKQKLITDSAQILLDAAAKSGSRQLLHELTMYLSAVEYKLFRYLYAADEANPEQAFRTKEARFDALVRCAHEADRAAHSMCGAGRRCIGSGRGGSQAAEPVAGEFADGISGTRGISAASFAECLRFHRGI